MGEYERQEKLLERKHEQLKEQVHQMRQQTATILKNISLTEQKIKLEKNYLNLKKSNIQTIGEMFQDYKVRKRYAGDVRFHWPNQSTTKRIPIESKDVSISIISGKFQHKT